MRLGRYHQRDAVGAPRPMQEHHPTAMELSMRGLLGILTNNEYGESRIK